MICLKKDAKEKANGMYKIRKINQVIRQHQNCILLPQLFKIGLHQEAHSKREWKDFVEKEMEVLCFANAVKKASKIYVLIFISTYIQRWVSPGDVEFTLTLLISPNTCEIQMRSGCKSIIKCKRLHFLAF